MAWHRSHRVAAQNRIARGAHLSYRCEGAQRIGTSFARTGIFCYPLHISALNARRRDMHLASRLLFIINLFYRLILPRTPALRTRRHALSAPLHRAP